MAASAGDRSSALKGHTTSTLTACESRKQLLHPYLSYAARFLGDAEIPRNALGFRDLAIAAEEYGDFLPRGLVVFNASPNQFVGALWINRIVPADHVVIF